MPGRRRVVGAVALGALSVALLLFRLPGSGTTVNSAGPLSAPAEAEPAGAASDAETLAGLLDEQLPFTRRDAFPFVVGGLLVALSVFAPWRPLGRGKSWGPEESRPETGAVRVALVAIVATILALGPSGLAGAQVPAPDPGPYVDSSPPGTLPSPVVTTTPPVGYVGGAGYVGFGGYAGRGLSPGLLAGGSPGPASSEQSPSLGVLGPEETSASAPLLTTWDMVGIAVMGAGLTGGLLLHYRRSAP